MNHFVHILAVALAAGIVATLVVLPVSGDDPDLLWGEDHGCFRGSFTRDKPLAERARPIDPVNQDSDFTVRFRFQTVGRGTYGAVIYVGVHQSGADSNVNGAGVNIFRHNDQIGLVAAPFVWDSAGQSERYEKKISLQYDTAYDVSCSYSGGAKTMTLSILDAISGEQVGDALVRQLPDGTEWSADQLAIWNYADDYASNMQLTVLIDQLRYNQDPPLNFATDLSELPSGEDARFTWYQAPLAPLVSELSAPREVLAGEDAQFVATVQRRRTGRANFALKTYAGQTLWQKSAPIVEGQASVVLTGAEAANLDKGSRVLVATVNNKQERSGYAAVRLRGRIFRDVTVAPEDLQPGDEIIITDMSLVGPEDAVSEHSEKGKWWRRQYTLPDDDERHSLLGIEERDMVNPESCIAPRITLPLNLEGWYEVWVRTYRYRQQGGIDVKLSRDRHFHRCNPLEVKPSQGGAEYGALVDIFYHADDLTGQDLIFQQPFGTHSSEVRLCNAALAGVRLVKLSDEQVAQLQAERARTDNKIMGFHDDYGTIMTWGAKNRDVISRIAEPLRDQSGAFLSLELGEECGLIIPTPYTSIYQMPTYHREYHWRSDAFARWCFENDINILAELTDYAHQVDVKVFASIFLSRCFNWAFINEHPDWRVKRGRGTLDYANPQVHDYNVKKFAWIIENHDIDGFIVDYTRYGHYFNEDEPNKFEHMNDFLRKLRAAVDEVNAKQERKCLLAVSFGDRSWHLKHWGSGELTDQGLDVDTWIEEGLVDMLIPEGPTIIDFVEKAKGSGVEVWPRKVGGVTLSTHEKVSTLGPKGIEREVKWTLDRGADGVYFFNHYTWTSLGRLGFKEELELRTRTDDVYGFREGLVASFTTWYPHMEQRNGQRNAFKPLTIAADAQRHVDEELIVPIRNTFDQPVTADVSWIIPEEAAGQWTIAPARGTVDIAPGEQGELAFHLAGTASGYEGTPAPYVELSTDEEVVFRYQMRLRVVSRMACRRVSSAPTIDGDLSDAAWAEAGGLQTQHFFPTGKAATVPWTTTMAAAYDDENLYLAYDCAGADLSGVAEEPPARDAREIYQGDNIQVLVDAAGTERAYLGFVITPAGAQADFRNAYESFVGQFGHKRDWNAEWTASVARREDGYAIEVAIPLTVFGATPQPGSIWRLNVVAKSRVLDGEPITAAWASPEKPLHLPRNYGTLHGALVFE